MRPSTRATRSAARRACTGRAGSDIVGVELTDESIRLADLPVARRRTVVVLGHESDGIPPEATELLDRAVEIPMIGTGLSLNVAVAGYLAWQPTKASRSTAWSTSYPGRVADGSGSLVVPQADECR